MLKSRNCFRTGPNSDKSIEIMLKPKGNTCYLPDCTLSDDGGVPVYFQAASGTDPPA
ncbi:hypothetical protein CA85_47990 [Allorhodopirellula solitaria]|uniref:Uncharacterized protein n=1 Tax=Allorhodopirellula solitaria TaxID=2527987 RepID=A0A5C5WZI1_9BACT|nr:hypothetical protein CA85_47990 [Allorhodopirellula solitaria]